MSGLPVFADPSTSVVYHTVPSASNTSDGTGVGLVGSGYTQQQQLPPTVAMMVVQNNQQQRNESLSNMPLPPGMEVVLGDKKYKIHYQSYEMTREKATEYIAKCTGTPYSRMSAPPDPESFYRTAGVVGGSRSDGAGGLGGTYLPTAADPMGVKPAAVSTTIAGDRGTRRMSSTSTAASEEIYQKLKTPDEVYTAMTPAASGLPPEITREGALPRPPLIPQSQQQQHQQYQQQLPNVPEQKVFVTDSSNYQATAYAPPPKDGDQKEKNSGYFWEDGVWKVWQADSGKIPSDAPGDAIAASKILPPLPVQQKQYSQQPQPPYTLQLQAEIPQYQYQYSQQQQQQPQLQPQQQPPSLLSTSTTLDPSSFLSQYSQTHHHPPHLPPLRGPPPEPTGLIRGHHGSASNTHVSGATGADPMMPRYMI